MKCAYCRKGNVYSGICDVCEIPNLRKPGATYYKSKDDPLAGHYSGGGGEGMGICFIIALIATIIEMAC